MLQGTAEASTSRGTGDVHNVTWPVIIWKGLGKMNWKVVLVAVEGLGWNGLSTRYCLTIVIFIFAWLFYNNSPPIVRCCAVYFMWIFWGSQEPFEVCGNIFNLHVREQAPKVYLPKVVQLAGDSQYKTLGNKSACLYKYRILASFKVLELWFCISFMVIHTFCYEWIA